MSHHKKQHFVPACYLRAWCDPDTPKKQTPYVWMFDKDGSNSRKKAPEKIFHETDMYTIQKSTGERDLSIEHRLSRFEDQFCQVRDKKLSQAKPLNTDDHAFLRAFLAAAMSRTPVERERLRDMWEGPLRQLKDNRDRMMAWAKTASPEERWRMGRTVLPPAHSIGRISLEDVEAAHENPLQEMLPSLISARGLPFCQMDLAILQTDCETGFITSDNPCVLIDAEMWRRPPEFRFIVMTRNSIEVTFPVSPRQCLFLNRVGVNGYLDIPAEFAHRTNRLTREYASQHIVVRTNRTEPAWFEPYVEPDDSWDRIHAEDAAKEDRDSLGKEKGRT